MRNIVDMIIAPTVMMLIGIMLNATNSRSIMMLYATMFFKLIIFLLQRKILIVMTLAIDKRAFNRLW